MTKPYYDRLRDALKPDSQTERAFFVDQLERCYELLKDTCNNAICDKDGKPIIYCRLKAVGNLRFTAVVNLHCKDAGTNQHVNLNYVAAIVLSGTDLKDPKEGVIIDLEEYPTVQSLVNALAKCWNSRPKSNIGLKGVRIPLSNKRN